MISIINERGKGALQTIIVIIILFAAVYLMVKFFPTVQKSSKFDDYVKNVARAARDRPGYDETMIKNIEGKAAELGLNVTRKNITIALRPGYVNIRVNYTMEVETPFYTFKRHFNVEHENPIF